MRRLALLAALCMPALFAQDPTRAFPNNYKVVIDNPDFTVLRVHYGPHEKVGVHDHSAHSTVYVYLNDSGPVRFQHSEEAKPFTLDRPPTHAGAFRVSPGRIETHTVENLSALPSDYLRVELKRVPVRSLPEEFRGQVPPPPFRLGTTVAYDNPRLRVERIICPPREPCAIPAEPRSSVLVQVPAAPMTAADWAAAYHRADETSAVPAGQTASLQAHSDQPFQVLRISVPKS